MYPNDTHPTAGLDFDFDVDHGLCFIQSVVKGTPAHKLPQWCQCLKNAYTLALDGRPTYKADDLCERILNPRHSQALTATLTL